jgi:hypothetical protein
MIGGSVALDFEIYGGRLNLIFILLGKTGEQGATLPPTTKNLIV